MEANGWLDGDVGCWFLRSLAYEVKHPVLAWATCGECLRHGDVVCLRGGVGTLKSFILAQTLAEFLTPQSAGGVGAECLLLLGNDSISPHLLREVLAAQLARYHADCRRNRLSNFARSNLHVVSVGTVSQLKTFVNLLPELLNGTLSTCRVFFVDDLDLGMGSVSSFSPQMSQLTDVVRAFLQAACRHNLLFIYGLQRRLPFEQQACMQRCLHAAVAGGLSAASGNILNRQQQLVNETKKRKVERGEEADGRRGPLPWRPPRRFILHLLRESVQQVQSSCPPPQRFVCSLNVHQNAVFTVTQSGQLMQSDI
ncbi:hypothetical protein Efla_002161 [Eimeria flavescens]